MSSLLSFQTTAVLLAGAALLSGCCANNTCQADDPYADAVVLRFSRAFNVNDLDTLIIQRYPKKFTAFTKPETVTLVRTTVPVRGDSVLLNNAAPFARVGTSNLSPYRFVVQYLAHPNGVNKPVVTTAFVIDSIHLQGSLNGDGCCTNYTNTSKIVFARDSVFNLKQQPFLKITK